MTTGAAIPAASAKVSASGGEHVAGWMAPRFFRLRRMALGVAAALVSFNIWTGCPLFAVWVGSQFEGWVGARAPSTGVSMKAILVVVVVLALLELALTLLMTRINDAYDKLTGRPHEARRTSPWLRSLRGEREGSALKKYGVSAVERIAMISVIVCVLAFEAWFVFSPGSALPY